MIINHPTRADEELEAQRGRPDRAPRAGKWQSWGPECPSGLAPRDRLQACRGASLSVALRVHLCVGQDLASPEGVGRESYAGAGRGVSAAVRGQSTMISADACLGSRPVPETGSHSIELIEETPLAVFQCLCVTPC